MENLMEHRIMILILRCVEHAKNVVHIPKVLYHWRAHKDSTAENPESKLYAFEAGARAVQAHYDRVGINAKVESTKYLGNLQKHISITGKTVNINYHSEQRSY